MPSKSAQRTLHWFILGQPINWNRLPWRVFKRVVRTELGADHGETGSNIYKLYTPPLPSKAARWNRR